MPVKKIFCKMTDNQTVRQNGLNKLNISKISKTRFKKFSDIPLKSLLNLYRSIQNCVQNDWSPNITRKQIKSIAQKKKFHNPPPSYTHAGTHKLNKPNISKILEILLGKFPTFSQNFCKNLQIFSKITD